MKRIFTALFLAILLLGISSAQETSYFKRVKIKSLSGEEVYSAKFYEEKIKVEVPRQTLEAPAKSKDGKRKYEVGGDVFAEVKYTADGFKLRTENGKLLWKVKIRSDEIEISDNEEMASPYRIRKSGDKWKLSDKDKDIAEVKWYSDSDKLKLKAMNGAELFVAKTKKLSVIIAIPGCQRIETAHQAILMTELEVLEK